MGPHFRKSVTVPARVCLGPRCSCHSLSSGALCACRPVCRAGAAFSALPSVCWNAVSPNGCIVQDRSAAQQRPAAGLSFLLPPETRSSSPRRGGGPAAGIGANMVRWGGPGAAAAASIGWPAGQLGAVCHLRRPNRAAGELREAGEDRGGHLWQSVQGPGQEHGQAGGAEEDAAGGAAAGRQGTAAGLHRGGGCRGADCAAPGACRWRRRACRPPRCARSRCCRCCRRATTSSSEGVRAPSAAVRAAADLLVAPVRERGRAPPPLTARRLWLQAAVRGAPGGERQALPVLGERLHRQQAGGLRRGPGSAGGARCVKSFRQGCRKTARPAPAGL